jgi:hypothetical protein
MALPIPQSCGMFCGRVATTAGIFYGNEINCNSLFCSDPETVRRNKFRNGFPLAMSEKIQFEASSRLVPDTDSPVRIIVDFEKPTRVRGIHAAFHAAERTEATYTVTTSDGKGKTRTETRTAVEFHDIVHEPFLLFGKRRMGFFSRLIDSLLTWFGRGKHELVERGRKEFEINLKIPPDAPPSFKARKCEVFYRLEVQIDLPIKVDWTKSRSFDVGRQGATDDVNPVHGVFPDQAGRSFWDRTMGKNVTLNLAIDRDSMSPGEQALAMLTVETPEPLNVNGISVELVGTESTTAQGHKDSHIHRHPLQAVDSPNVISSESVHEFDLRIPEIDGPFTQNGKNFDVCWSIEVRLKVPWAKDPVIRLPVKLLPAN